ncbi:nuclear transport factor 2 family protein [Novosphingobium sp. BL-8A]|uniref:nuclear transport factor 2 family protein n=1 Tax=Novosphingobium sp. BL-8A TaxID=3127639 RepID=UPI003757224B
MDLPVDHPAPSPTSSERIRELLVRNLREVFGENDPDRRLAALNELWTEDCALHVPPGVIRGREEIAAFAGQLRAAHPDFVYTPIDEAQVQPDAGRLAWGSGPSGEPARYTGWDVAITKNGRIATLIVFLDKAGE